MPTDTPPPYFPQNPLSPGDEKTARKLRLTLLRLRPARRARGPRRRSSASSTSSSRCSPDREQTQTVSRNLRDMKSFFPRLLFLAALAAPLVLVQPPGGGRADARRLGERAHAELPRRGRGRRGRAAARGRAARSVPRGLLAPALRRALRRGRADGGRRLPRRRRLRAVQAAHRRPRRARRGRLLPAGHGHQLHHAHARRRPRARPLDAAARVHAPARQQPLPRRAALAQGGRGRVLQHGAPVARRPAPDAGRGARAPAGASCASASCCRSRRSSRSTRPRRITPTRRSAHSSTRSRGRSCIIFRRRAAGAAARSRASQTFWPTARRSKTRCARLST